MSGVGIRTVKAGEGEIECLETGEGAPFVFFHGGGGVLHNAAFFPEMGKRFHVLAPARPGYDGSTGRGDTPREAAETMAAFIRAAAGGPVDLMGESAGGAPACWVAVLYPELVDHLILAAPAAFATGEAPASAAPPTPEAMALRLFGPNPGWTSPPSAEDQERRRRNNQAAAARPRPPRGNPDLRERLGEIKAPTLILWGTADEVVPPEQSDIYLQGIPGSRRIYIDGAAHSLPVAACAETVAHVTAFLGDQRRD